MLFFQHKDMQTRKKPSKKLAKNLLRRFMVYIHSVKEGMRRGAMEGRYSTLSCAKTESIAYNVELALSEMEI